MKRMGGDKEEREGGENERRGEGAVFFAMQVLEIPAGGRGFPLVILMHVFREILKTILSMRRDFI